MTMKRGPFPTAGALVWRALCILGSGDSHWHTATANDHMRDAEGLLR